MISYNNRLAAIRKLGDTRVSPDTQGDWRKCTPKTKDFAKDFGQVDWIRLNPSLNFGGTQILTNHVAIKKYQKGSSEPECHSVNDPSESISSSPSFSHGIFLFHPSGRFSKTPRRPCRKRCPRRSVAVPKSWRWNSVSWATERNNQSLDQWGAGWGWKCHILVGEVVDCMTVWILDFGC